MPEEEPSNNLGPLVANFGLNVKQARFAILVHGTIPPTIAYSYVYANNASPEVGSKAYHSAASAASRLLKNAKVLRAVDALNSGEEDIISMTRREKRGILAMMARGHIPGVKPVDRARAIREDNLMTGEHNDDSDVDDLSSNTKQRLLVEMVVKAQGT